MLSFVYFLVPFFVFPASWLHSVAVPLAYGTQATPSVCLRHALRT
ncbi:hypothetical protein [Nostoc sp.]